MIQRAVKITFFFEILGVTRFLKQIYFNRINDCLYTLGSCYFMLKSFLFITLQGVS